MEASATIVAVIPARGGGGGAELEEMRSRCERAEAALHELVDRQLLSSTPPPRHGTARTAAAIVDEDAPTAEARRLRDETNASVEFQIQADMRDCLRGRGRWVQAPRRTLAVWSEESVWARDTGGERRRAQEGKWRELWLAAELEVSCLASMSDDSGGPSMVVQLDGAKRMAQARVSELETENEELRSSCAEATRMLETLQSLVRGGNPAGGAEPAPKQAAEDGTQPLNAAVVSQLFCSYLAAIKEGEAEMAAMLLQVIVSTLEFTDKQKVQIGMLDKWAAKEGREALERAEGEGDGTFSGLIEAASSTWSQFLSTT